MAGGSAAVLVADQALPSNGDVAGCQAQAQIGAILTVEMRRQNVHVTEERGREGIRGMAIKLARRRNLADAAL